MLFLKDLLTCLFTNYEINTEMENDEQFHLEITSNDYLSPSIVNINQAINFLNARDHLKMTIIFGNADPLTYNSNDSDANKILEEYSTEYEYQIGESIKFEVDIKKTKVCEVISIYDFKTFVNHLNTLTITQGFSIFSRAFSTSNSLIFEVNDLTEVISTESIMFRPAKADISTLDEVPNRKNLIEKQRSTVLFANSSDFPLIPNDFRLDNSLVIIPTLQSLFGRYCTVLSCIYILDISTLETNTLNYTINGYKSIKGVGNFDNPHPNSEQYFNIYKWTYTGGNLTDKIGLTRNIVTLHFDDLNNLSFKGRPYESILSSYKVYEKQNIKQYIEIRSKISDQLLDFNNRANKIIETFASGFQKSALALISFYLSAIAVKVLGKLDQNYIFSTEATVLSLVFITGSFIYYKGAKWEVTEQRKRFVSSYENLKLRYTDLLNFDDIKRIVNDDKEYNEDLAFIDNKMKVYSRIWIGLLTILLISTLFLYNLHTKTIQLFIYNIYENLKSL